MIQGASKAANHWPLLDFLRATAALLVVLAHTRAYYFLNIDFLDQPNIFLKLFYFVTGLGHEAVVIFFVLSGFLIGGSLTDSMQRGRFELPRYLIARFVRIFIVYFPALIITEAVFVLGWLVLRDLGDVPTWVAPIFSRRELDLGGVAQAICFVSGLQGFSCREWEQNPALWSLGFEWALYLVAPAVIQLILWKASPALRLLGLVIVLAIAGAACRHSPLIESVFWFAAWFLGVGCYRIVRAGPVPLSVGFLGLGLIIAGMVLHHANAVSQLSSDMIIAAGVATAIACGPLIAFPLAPRFFAWAAGFSYTLYAIHAPFIYLVVTSFRQVGYPPDIPPSPAPFMELAVTVAICLLAAYLVSLVTERRTAEVRAALSKLCPPAWEPRTSDRSQQQLGALKEPVGP
jgi:peptidoglycan/LPS O-acetylase OafA/YrhL